jgi:hypothetical protein
MTFIYVGFYLTLYRLDRRNVGLAAKPGSASPMSVFASKNVAVFRFFAMSADPIMSYTDIFDRRGDYFEPAPATKPLAQVGR